MLTQLWLLQHLDAAAALMSIANDPKTSAAHAKECKDAARHILDSRSLTGRRVSSMCISRNYDCLLTCVKCTERHPTGVQMRPC